MTVAALPSGASTTMQAGVPPVPLTRIFAMRSSAPRCLGTRSSRQAPAVNSTAGSNTDSSAARSPASTDENAASIPASAWLRCSEKRRSGRPSRWIRTSLPSMSVRSRYGTVTTRERRSLPRYSSTPDTTRSRSSRRERCVSTNAIVCGGSRASDASRDSRSCPPVAAADAASQQPRQASSRPEIIEVEPVERRAVHLVLEPPRVVTDPVREPPSAVALAVDPLREPLEPQMVPVAAPVDAEAEHDGRAERRGDLPGRGRKRGAAAEKRRDARFPARAQAVREQRDDRAVRERVADRE